jgi:molybdopterin synthase sulfur carrier subunit
MPAATFSVAIPTPLRSYTAGAAKVEVRVAAPQPTLADLLAALDVAYPGIRFRMIDEAGRVRPHVQVFVNTSIERDPAAVLPPGAEIMLVGALSGG